MDGSVQVLNQARQLESGVLLKCLYSLRKYATKSIGLFRNNATVTEVKRLWVALCQNKEMSLDNEDKNLVASLVLWHLQQLTPPLLPYSLHNTISEFSEDENSNVSMIAPLFDDISELHWENLRRLMELLQEVSAQSKLNGLTTEILAQIFAPLIYRPAGTAFMSVRHSQAIKQAEHVVQLMITHHQDIFRNSAKTKNSLCSPRPAVAALSIEIPKAHPYTVLEKQPAQLRGTLTASSDLAALDVLIAGTVSGLFKGMLELPSSPVKAEERPRVVVGPDLGEVDFYEGLPIQVHAFPSAGNALTNSNCSSYLAGAVERRRMVAACRILRHQIGSFEDNWTQRRGRRPRGTERCLLASTYSQYRVWKRSIRDDAALQIQLFWRKFTQSEYSRRGSRIHARPSQHDEPLLCDGILDSESYTYSEAPKEKTNTLNRHRSGSITSVASGSSLPSIYNNKNQHSQISIFTSNGAIGSPPKSAKSPPKASSLEHLIEQKKMVKDKLKSFDVRFVQEHGRMPSKAEKEPIRHLYENYNSLKSQIKKLELTIKKYVGDTAGNQPNILNRNSNSLPPERGGYNSQEAPNTVAPPINPQNKQLSEIEMLRKSKRDFHIMLKNYERQFKLQHGREVSSPEDIAPVEKEYQKYKEIKKKLTRLTGER